jgi:hypothetical protein
MLAASTVAPGRVGPRIDTDEHIRVNRRRRSHGDFQQPRSAQALNRPNTASFRSSTRYPSGGSYQATDANNNGNYGGRGEVGA